MKLISASAAVRPRVNRIEPGTGVQAAVPSRDEGRCERQEDRVDSSDWPGDRSESAQISRKFSAFAGSGANARALVTGLRMGHAIVLDMPGAAGEPGALTFAPLTGMLRHGNVYLVLAMAERSLAAMGIASPTPQQIETVLNGGFLTATQNGVARYVFAPGVLKLRSRGHCWRSIARANGLIHDSDAHGRGTGDDAASNEVMHGTRHAAGSVAPAFASLVFALSLSLGVQSKARTNLDAGVETCKGRAVLSGFVDSCEQIRKAECIASAVRGVQAVQDSVPVKQP